MLFKKRVFCTGLALLTATSLLIPGVGLAKKVKKPKLSKSSLTLKVGEKKKLTVKNTKKKVKWSSSNKKIATVNKKGVVTAKKAGKSTIFAKVAKKTLKCKVVVKRTDKKKVSAPTTAPTSKKNSTAIQISNMSIVNDSTLLLELSSAQKLETSAFTIMMKKYSTGAYNRVLDIVSVFTADNKSYKITIDDNCAFILGHTVKLSIKGLTGSAGVTSKEVIYTDNDLESNEDLCLETNVGTKYDDFVFMPEGEGLLAAKKLEAPEGISAKVDYQEDYERNIVRFSGIPKKAGHFDCKLEFVDELGKKYISTIHWLIGSEDSISAYVQDTYFMYTEASHKSTQGEHIEISGGSGIYEVEIVDNANNSVRIDEDYYSDDTNNQTGLIIENSTPGNKTYSVKITDAKNSSLSIILKGNIFVEDAFTVKGKVTDASGEAITKRAHLEFVSKNDDIKKKYGETCDIWCDEKTGEYTVSEIAAGEYDVYFSFGNTYKKIARNVEINSNTQIDFKVKDLYLVSLTCDGSLDADLLKKENSIDWYEEDCYKGEGLSLLLPNGNYDLEAKVSVGMYSYELKTSFSVDGKATKAKIEVVNKIDHFIGDIYLNEAKNIIFAQNDYRYYKYYKFVPTETDVYKFYSESNCDTAGTLLRKTVNGYEEIAYDDDSITDEDFKIVKECKVGEEYYIGVRGFLPDIVGKSIKIMVEKTDEEPDDYDW